MSLKKVRVAEVIDSGEYAYVWIGDRDTCICTLAGPAALRKLAEAILAHLGQRHKLRRPKKRTTQPSAVTLLKTLSPEQVIDIAKKAGIYTKTGLLTKFYRPTKEATR
jgi:hypothetical protein